MPNKVNKKYDFDLDLADQSFIDFKKSKSISITTKLSDIKESKIGELYDTKILHDKLNSLCIKKVSAKGLPITKKVSKDICECLFDKNKDDMLKLLNTSQEKFEMEINKFTSSLVK